MYSDVAEYSTLPCSGGRNPGGSWFEYPQMLHFHVDEVGCSTNALQYVRHTLHRTMRASSSTTASSSGVHDTPRGTLCRHRTSRGKTRTVGWTPGMGTRVGRGVGLRVRLWGARWLWLGVSGRR